MWRDCRTDPPKHWGYYLCRDETGERMYGFNDKGWGEDIPKEWLDEPPAAETGQSGKSP